MTNPKCRLLLPLLLLFALACGKSGGGGEVEDMCADFSRKISNCLDFDKGESRRTDECVDALDDAEEIDGEECFDAQFTALECVTADTCDHILDFLSVTINDLYDGGGNPVLLDYCDAEIRAAFILCPLSI